jgi:hypothetical protein
MAMVGTLLEALEVSALAWYRRVKFQLLCRSLLQRGLGVFKVLSLGIVDVLIVWDVDSVACIPHDLDDRIDDGILVFVRDRQAIGKQKRKGKQKEGKVRHRKNTTQE